MINPSSVPRLQELAGYQAAIERAYYPCEFTDIAQPRPFEWEFETKSFGQFALSRLRSTATYRARRRRGGRNDHDFILHVMEEGRVVFSQRQNELIAEAGTLVLINPDPLLTTTKLTASDVLAMSIPARLVSMYFPDARNWGLSIRPSAHGPGAVLHEFVRCCWRQRDSIRAAEAASVSRTLIQLVGTTFGTADANLQACKSRSMQMHWMRIRDFVAENLTNEDLSVDYVADSLRISKSYMFAILKGANTKLSQLIMRQRLEHCRQMLADESMDHTSISDIAYSAGFRALSHFSRCFSEQYGESPRAFRLARRRG